jgi:hypothetical protein
MSSEFKTYDEALAWLERYLDLWAIYLYNSVNISSWIIVCYYFHILWF